MVAFVVMPLFMIAFVVMPLACVVVLLLMIAFVVVLRLVVTFMVVVFMLMLVFVFVLVFLVPRIFDRFMRHLCWAVRGSYPGFDASRDDGRGERWRHVVCECMRPRGARGARLASKQEGEHERAGKGESNAVIECRCCGYQRSGLTWAKLRLSGLQQLLVSLRIQSTRCL